MKPISFVCEETLRGSPSHIANQILDLSRWSQFQGYGVVPGIKHATFEKRTDEIVGSRIRVTSTDGTNYVEEIVEWNPESHVVIVMKNFSAPLAALASSVTETWRFEPAGESTKVTRSFEMQPKSFLTKPPLYLISLALQKAITRHLDQIKKEG